MSPSQQGRFARSTSEAFDCERFAAIERVRYDVTHAGHRAVFALCVVGCAVMVTALLMGVM